MYAPRGVYTLFWGGVKDEAGSTSAEGTSRCAGAYLIKTAAVDKKDKKEKYFSTLFFSSSSAQSLVSKLMSSLAQKRNALGRGQVPSNYVPGPPHVGYC
jgi:hypothetical protein